MAEVISCADTFNNAIIYYCRKNKLKLIEFIQKVPIDTRYSEMYDGAVKAKVLNLLTNSEETYLFLGKKAKYYGYMLTDLRKLQ